MRRALVVVSALLTLLVAAADASSLHDAIARGDTAAIAKLLAKHADPNAADRKLGLPLELAAQGGDPRVVRLLLDGGADARRGAPVCRALDRDGIAPGQRLAVVEELLAAGADPDRDEPLVTAVRAQLDSIAFRLITAGAALDSAWRPSRRGERPRSSLIPIYASWHYTTDSPLLAAIRDGRTAVALRLIAAGADVEHAIFDVDGGERVGAWTSDQPLVRPLNLAVSVGHAEVVQALLERGADPNRGGYSVERYRHVVDGVLVQDSLRIVAHGALVPGTDSTLCALLLAHGARAPGVYVASQGDLGWASPLFEGGRQNSITLNADARSLAMAEQTPEFMARHAALLRAQGVPEAVVAYFTK